MNDLVFNVESDYLAALDHIMTNGEDRTDRTGTGTRAVFGVTLRHDMANGFPLLTTKRMPFKAITSELLWFIEGTSDERRLAEILYGTRDPSRTTIWTGNAQADYWKPKAKFDGDLGPVYGVQWRAWPTFKPVSGFGYDQPLFEQGPNIDQLAEAVKKLKTNPTDRRIIVSAWNVAELGNVALPPCHMFMQFFKHNDGRLDLQMYQRSVDSFLGLPFNIASYALLLMLVAQVTDSIPGELIMQLGDTHIYSNHHEAVMEQLQRPQFPLPTVQLNPSVKDIDGFTMDDITLVDYQSHGPIKAEMAV